MALLFDSDLTILSDTGVGAALGHEQRSRTVSHMNSMSPRDDQSPDGYTSLDRLYAGGDQRSMQPSSAPVHPATAYNMSVDASPNMQHERTKSVRFQAPHSSEYNPLPSKSRQLSTRPSYDDRSSFKQGRQRTLTAPGPLQIPKASEPGSGAASFRSKANSRYQTLTTASSHLLSNAAKAHQVLGAAPAAAELQSQTNSAKVKKMLGVTAIEMSSLTASNVNVNTAPATMLRNSLLPPMVGLVLTSLILCLHTAASVYHIVVYYTAANSYSWEQPWQVYSMFAVETAAFISCLALMTLLVLLLHRLRQSQLAIEQYAALQPSSAQKKQPDLESNNSNNTVPLPYVSTSSKPLVLSMLTTLLVIASAVLYCWEVPFADRSVFSSTDSMVVFMCEWIASLLCVFLVLHLLRCFGDSWQYQSLNVQQQSFGQQQRVKDLQSQAQQLQREKREQDSYMQSMQQTHNTNQRDKERVINDLREQLHHMSKTNGMDLPLKPSEAAELVQTRQQNQQLQQQIQSLHASQMDALKQVSELNNRILSDHQQHLQQLTEVEERTNANHQRLRNDESMELEELRRQHAVWSHNATVLAAKVQRRDKEVARLSAELMKRDGALAAMQQAQNLPPLIHTNSMPNTRTSFSSALDAAANSASTGASRRASGAWNAANPINFNGPERGRLRRGGSVNDMDDGMSHVRHTTGSFSHQQHPLDMKKITLHI